MSGLSICCWHCNHEINDLPERMPRYARCSSCQAELHSCRQCRSFNTKVLGQCTHDRADRVERKNDSNFCVYFQAAPRPVEVIEDTGAAPLDELHALFGIESEPATPRAPASPSSSRAELDALFGLNTSDAKSDSP